MASWIIVATFIAAALYLITHSRTFSGLPLVASIATAMLMCFFGLLFSAAASALFNQLDWPIRHPLAQSGLIPLGVLLGLWIRHRWKK